MLAKSIAAWIVVIASKHVLCALCVFALSFCDAGAGAVSKDPANTYIAPSPKTVAALDAEIRAFLEHELAAHLTDLKSIQPPQERVVGALTTGEYTWGTFMRAVAAFAQLSGATTLAGKNLPRTIAEIGLLEAHLGGTRFSQLYAALSLRHYGTDLTRNALWQALTPEERAAWTKLTDVTAFYDPSKKQVINLPENYLGVAARIAAMAWEVKLLNDRALLDSLLDRAAIQFTSGALYADDGLPTGRFDRYSNEYARYVWEAAQVAGRKDLLDALRPSLRAQMRLWWDLVGPDGYGYPWGRSLGIVSYLDTLEIVGFLAITPAFRPAPLNDLLSAYNLAWQYLCHDFKEERHLLSLYDFGRGNFSYISIDREWQQTTGFFGKLAHAHIQLMSGLRASELTEFPAAPSFPSIARFEFFNQSNRPAGVWLVRQGAMQFALPITTATKPGVADYLPAPHGLAGFAAPVEQLIPALVPFIELSDGRTIVAADGADAIEPGADGRSLRVKWTRWAQLGAKPAEFFDPGIETTVEWRLDRARLTRTETLTARAPISIARWRVVVPTTGADWQAAPTAATSTNSFSGRDGRLDVSVLRADWPYSARVHATGNGADGRGARGRIPLHLVLEATNIALQPALPKGWTLQLAVNGHSPSH